MLSKHAIGRCVSLLVGGCVLLSAATAQAAVVFTNPPTQVDAIEQWRDSQPRFPSYGRGGTFVHLRGVPCSKGAGGFYELKNNTKQSHILEVLLSALSSSRQLVTLNYDTETCVINAVGVCTTPGLCG